MKKAYLFGAAALLILLIVVAYIASNRQKEEAVCELPPPQVVGPTAAPVKGPEVRTLTFDDGEDDEVLVLPTREPATRIRYDAAQYPTEEYYDDITSDQLERLSSLQDKYLDVAPLGGPLPNTPIVGGPQPAIDLSALSPGFRDVFMDWAAGSCAATPYKAPEVFDESESEDEGSLRMSQLVKDTSLFLNDDLMDKETQRQKRKYAESGVKLWEGEHSDQLEMQKSYMLTLPVTSPLRKKFFQEERAADNEGRYQRLLDLYTGDYKATPTKDELFDEYMHRF